MFKVSEKEEARSTVGAAGLPGVGRVEERTDQSLKLILPQGESLEIASDSIKKITKSNTSVMPPMGSVLTKHELRDLIAYLETL